MFKLFNRGIAYNKRLIVPRFPSSNSYAAAGKRFNSKHHHKSSSDSGSSSSPGSGKLVAGSFVVSALCAAGAYYYGQSSVLSNPPAHLFPLESTTPLDSILPPKYCTENDLEQAIKEISTVVTPDRITNSKGEIQLHSGNDFSTHPPESHEKPSYVIYPLSTEEVSEIMKITHKYSVPVTPYCGGTSLEGHFHSTRQPSVVLDTSKMDKILKLHHEDLDVVVQSGVNWQELNEQLDGYGLLMGCDCGPSARISGMVSTNASGMNATKYGAMINNIISLTVVLADGTVVKTKQRPRKSSAGYNLTHLFIGSEGTLGIVTEATVKLQVQPGFETVVVGQFPTILDCTNAVTDFFQSGIQPNIIELLDENSMHCINYSGHTTHEWSEVPTLFLKVGGINKTVVNEHIKEMKKISMKNNCKAFVFAKDKKEQEELFSARKNIFYSALEYGRSEIHEDARLWVTDIAVPLSKLSPVLDEIRQLMSNSGLEYIIVGHVGDGNFHADMFYKPEDLEKCKKVVDKMMEVGLRNEGTSSGEHGIGNGKRHFLRQELGEEAVDLMRKIKMAVDPKRLLNPDKIFKIDPNDEGDK